jgi:predicted CoA-binding protein
MERGTDKLRIMVIGASRQREKYGNKALRAYLKNGHEVFPVNPASESIEGARSYTKASDVPGPVDRALIYLHADQALPVLEELARRGDVQEVWLAPGADDPAVVLKSNALGLNTIQACSILAVGETPQTV